MFLKKLFGKGLVGQFNYLVRDPKGINDLFNKVRPSTTVLTINELHLFIWG